MNNTSLNTAPGNILITVLVFGGILTMIASGLLSLVGYRYKLTSREIAALHALHIAEAGVNYYRWHLAHDPDDFTDGTSMPGPYEHNLIDPASDVVGTYSLEISGAPLCSTVVEITSTGWTVSEPDIKRSVTVRYGRPSLAKYAVLTNTNIWFGKEEEIAGPVHSNGGIRMDGEQNALFTSARETYICGPEHGCKFETKPGIWGEGEGGEQGLWRFPEGAVDFEGITFDLAQLKTKAKEGGLYLPTPSDAYGYHLKFKSDGSVEIYKVTKKRPNVKSWNGTEWEDSSYDIQDEKFFQSITIPESCDASNLIFAESDVWVDGDTQKPVLVAAARFPDLEGTNSNIIINGNLTSGGTKRAIIGLLAQKNVLIPLYSPDKLEIDAVLFAQKGHVFRNYYPSKYSPWHLRNEIELHGSIITNNIWTFSWVSGAEGPVTSGYKETETTYDTSLLFNPPPFFPNEEDYEFLTWDAKRR